MTSKRKIKRKYQKWSRWLDRMCALGPGIVGTRGYDRAWNRWARVDIRKVREE